MDQDTTEPASDDPKIETEAIDLEKTIDLISTFAEESIMSPDATPDSAGKIIYGKEKY